MIFFTKQIGYTIFRAGDFHFVYKYIFCVFGLGDIQPFFSENVYIWNIFASPRCHATASQMSVDGQKVPSDILRKLTWKLSPVGEACTL